MRRMVPQSLLSDFQELIRLKIKPSRIEYLSGMLNWAIACYNSETDYQNCLPCYMQRFRDPKARPDKEEGNGYWIKDQIDELLRQLRRGFEPKGNWMMCTSHDPLSNHSMTTCIEVLRALRTFRSLTAKMRFLSKFLSRIIPIASAEMMPMNALYGATITTLDTEEMLRYQPGTDPPMKQIESLNTLHALGYRTWASLEPCFSKMDINRLLELAPNLELCVIGKLNQVSSDKHHYDVLTPDDFRKQISYSRKQHPHVKIMLKQELVDHIYKKRKDETK